jgi:hypothetical protein
LIIAPVRSEGVGVKFLLIKVNRQSDRGGMGNPHCALGHWDMEESEGAVLFLYQESSLSSGLRLHSSFLFLPGTWCFVCKLPLEVGELFTSLWFISSGLDQ